MPLTFLFLGQRAMTTWNDFGMMRGGGFIERTSVSPLRISPSNFPFHASENHVTGMTFRVPGTSYHNACPSQPCFREVLFCLFGSSFSVRIRLVQAEITFFGCPGFIC
jgi:hypothetical protein